MDFFLGGVLLGAGAYAIKTAEQRRRIALLGRYLRPYQLERLMEQLTGGYLRALGEADPERCEPIWRLLQGTEEQVSDQLARLASAAAGMGEDEARVSRWPLAMPLATRLFPASTFDLREALAIHARGFAAMARPVEGQDRRQQAFTLSAELFLFQHTCHWYCRSKTVASARLLARHRTAYEQVLAAVSPATRQAWVALVRG